MRRQARSGCSLASIVLHPIFPTDSTDPIHPARIARPPAMSLYSNSIRKSPAGELRQTLDFSYRGALAAQVALDEIELEEQFLHLCHAQTLGIVRGVVIERRYFLLALGKIHGV